MGSTHVNARVKKHRDTLRMAGLRPVQIWVHTFVRLLLEELVSWHAELQSLGFSVLILAPLAHLYFELIHPFWDGNGRVGRIVEASLLHAAGYGHAPFALSRYYLTHIDRYFRLFNQVRKAADKGGEQYPNQEFVSFHLQGMLHTFNALQDRANQMIAKRLFEADLHMMLAGGLINARQFHLALQLMAEPGDIKLGELHKSSWYRGLYLRLSDKTRQRDLKKLEELKLIRLDGMSIAAVSLIPRLSLQSRLA